MFECVGLPPQNITVFETYTEIMAIRPTPGKRARRPGQDLGDLVECLFTIVYPLLSYYPTRDCSTCIVNFPLCGFLDQSVPLRKARGPQTASDRQKMQPTSYHMYYRPQLLEADVEPVLLPWSRQGCADLHMGGFHSNPFVICLFRSQRNIVLWSNNQDQRTRRICLRCSACRSQATQSVNHPD